MLGNFQCKATSFRSAEEFQVSHWDCQGGEGTFSCTRSQAQAPFPDRPQLHSKITSF